MINFHNPNDYWLPEDYDPKDDNLEGAIGAGCLVVLCYAVAFVVIILLVSLISGCSPRVIERTMLQHDTVRLTNTQRDSIYLHDSIHVKEWQAGDTVRIITDRWHTRWRDREMHDTAYIARRDTVQVAVVQQRDKPLSGWKWFQIWAGRIALLAIAIAAAVFIAKRFLRNKLP